VTLAIDFGDPQSPYFQMRGTNLNATLTLPAYKPGIMRSVAIFPEQSRLFGVPVASVRFSAVQSLDRNLLKAKK
jgi:hypothetical protein